MDGYKIRWKHHPHDFFGREKLTKMSGEEIEGRIVPKTSAEYINTNVVFDENDNPIATASPFTHPTRYLFTIPSLLLAISLFSFRKLIGQVCIVRRFYGGIGIMEITCTSDSTFDCLFIWRNTDLFDDYRKGKTRHHEFTGAGRKAEFTVREILDNSGTREC